MFYTVYKITNLVNGKTYIGCHKTDDLNDGYMGSGTYLASAKTKYGIENFAKEILHIFDNHEDMINKEIELVNEEFVADETTYNLTLGGGNGWYYANQNGLNTSWKDPEKRILKYSATLRQRLLIDDSLKNLYLRNLNNTSEKAIQNRKELYPNGTFSGKKHSDLAKEKIGLANSKHQTGERNSQFGTMWIHSDELLQSKRVKKTDPIPIGWCIGRKFYK